MVRMAIINAKVMIKFIKYLGFEQARQKGSHKFFRHIDGRTATVPDHRNEDLGKGLTNKILRDVKVSKEDFLKWQLKGKL